MAGALNVAGEVLPTRGPDRRECDRGRHISKSLRGEHEAILHDNDPAARRAFARPIVLHAVDELRPGY